MIVNRVTAKPNCKTVIVTPTTMKLTVKAGNRATMIVNRVTAKPNCETVLVKPDNCETDYETGQL